jgi:hypothetical protein
LTAQDVRHNFMSVADFSKYRTYKWVNMGGAHPDKIMDVQIKQAVDSQLASKGMTKTDSDKADLYIGYQTAVDKLNQYFRRLRLFQLFQLRRFQPSDRSLHENTGTCRSSKFGASVASKD